MPSNEAMLFKWQLTWTDHVVGMTNERLPTAVLRGEVRQDKRNVGRPHLCYTSRINIHVDAAETTRAADVVTRPQCRHDRTSTL